MGRFLFAGWATTCRSPMSNGPNPPPLAGSSAVPRVACTSCAGRRTDHRSLEIPQLSAGPGAELHKPTQGRSRRPVLALCVAGAGCAAVGVASEPDTVDSSHSGHTIGAGPVRVCRAVSAVRGAFCPSIMYCQRHYTPGDNGCFCTCLGSTLAVHYRYG